MEEEQKQQVALEAQAILKREILRLRSLPYDDLVRYLEPYAFEITAPSGRMFQVEVEALWDDRKRGHLRVIVSMDAGTGWRVRPYKSDDFIITPNGTFIGESNSQ